MKAAYMFAAMAALLICLAMFVPHNSLTGKVVKDDTCGPLGCVQLCEQNAVTSSAANQQAVANDDSLNLSNTACKKDMVCCETHWSSGICDYSFNCEKVRQYSLVQTLDVYKDTVKEQPAPIQPGFDNFYLPLIVIVTIICIVIFKYHNPPRD